MVTKKLAYVPVKLNGERTPGKNIKSFDNGYPLIQYMLKTLDIRVQERIINKVFCFCFNEKIVEFFPKETHTVFLKRDKSLDSSDTTVNDISENIKLFEVSPIGAIDVDYPEDFEIANIVWNEMKILYGEGWGEKCTVILSLSSPLAFVGSYGESLLCA
jgi:CMP-N-acetylneuraminic acid synthetase